MVCVDEQTVKPMQQQIQAMDPIHSVVHEIAQTHRSQINDKVYDGVVNEQIDEQMYNVEPQEISLLL